MAVSLLGDGMFNVALAWEVYRLSNVPSALAWVGVAAMLPRIVLLVYGGVLTDRVERRRLMIAADLLRLVAVGAAAVLMFTGGIRLWQLALVAAVAAAGSALFLPAFGAIVPELVPQELLTEANSLDQFVRPTSRLIGPALGGVLVAASGTGVAFALDAASFGVSALCLSLLTARPVLATASGSVVADVREGIAAVRQQAWLWGGVLASIPLNLASGAMFVLLPYIVKNDLHASAGTLGLVYSFGAVGSIVAAFAMGERGLPRRHIAAAYWGWAIGLAVTALYALADHAWELFAISLVSAGAITVGQVIWGVLMHRLVPKEVLGRVYSLDLFTAVALLPVSYLLTGAIADRWGTSTALYAGAALGSISTLLFLYLVPGMRATERDGSIHEAAGAAVG